MLSLCTGLVSALILASHLSLVSAQGITWWAFFLQTFFYFLNVMLAIPRLHVLLLPLVALNSVFAVRVLYANRRLCRLNINTYKTELLSWRMQPNLLSWIHVLRALSTLQEWNCTSIFLPKSSIKLVFLVHVQRPFAFYQLFAVWWE